LSIVVDEAKHIFSGQTVASSTSSPSLNFYPIHNFRSYLRFANCVHDDSEN